MPGPRHAIEDRSEAVHRDQRRGSAGLPPPVELGFDPIMVWPENLAYACDLLAFTQAYISWYRRELAAFQDRRLRARRAVAVDDKARIVLLHQGGVERVRDHAAEPGDADVPGDVAFALGFRNAEPTECARHRIARVIGDDQERRPAVRVVHRDRRRLIDRQQALRHLVHWRSCSRINEGGCLRHAGRVLGAKNAYYSTASDHLTMKVAVKVITAARPTGCCDRPRNFL